MVLRQCENGVLYHRLINLALEHNMTGFRTESDSMGELQVPEDASYGAQTQRAIQNFPVSGLYGECYGR